MTLVPNKTTAAILLAFGGIATCIPAHATLISSLGPVGFNESVSVTDTKATAGQTANNNALFGSTTFNKFDPNTGVLTKATVTLTSTRTPGITGNRVGTTTGTATGSGSSTPKLVLPSGETTFASATLTGNCNTTPCPYTVTGTSTAINSSVNITNTSTLANYVGAGDTFNAERRASTLSANSAGGATNTTTTYTSSWNGSIQLDYEYLLHANPSFDGTSDVNAWTIDFGTVLMNSSVSPMTFSLFNLGDANTVGLDLDSITSSGDDSILTTDLASFLNLVAGGAGNTFMAFFDTLNTGDFLATYTLGFSDNDIGAEATRRTYQMALTLKGTVAEPEAARLSSVPEPAPLTLLGIGLLSFVMARGKRQPI